jgi:hypothetical protein
MSFVPPARHLLRAKDLADARYFEPLGVDELSSAAGQDGLVLATTDGAKTWSAKHTGVGDELNSISCASSSSCVVSGSAGTVLSTAGGGTSWTVQGTGTALALTSASCPSATSCFAAGDAGTLLRVAPKARR